MNLQMVEVKPGMRGRFVESGELCAEFPYRAKALFAFEEVDGADICFFGMHVQVRSLFYLFWRLGSVQQWIWYNTAAPTTVGTQR